MNVISTTARTLQLGNGLEVTIDERGDAAQSPGTAVLVLHSGGGPQTITGLAAALSEHAYVVTPTHPGFNGTPRVPWLDSAADLADAYLDLLEELGLDTVMVIGNSIGGWIASEMALRDIQGRVRSLVLLNANGIRPDDATQVTDIRGLPPQAIGRLSFYSPAFRPDLATMTDRQRAVMVANQQVLAVYAGADFMFAPKLRRRLHRVTVPALVAWGEEDGIVTADYGRAYAAAFPKGHFTPIAEAGHFPQVEQPGAVLAAIGDFVDAVIKPDGDPAGRGRRYPPAAARS
jgi:pimeloyl-ACP methyl ester carboxylesterase